jgi:NitT/TauT family transport system substrate-binding protein
LFARAVRARAEIHVMEAEVGLDREAATMRSRETHMNVTRRTFLAASAAAATLPRAAFAADKAAVGVLRFVSSGGFFLAVERGYFAAEGIQPDIKFFEAAQPIVVAIASGDLQFGLTAITGGSLNLAGKGAVKVIASQGAERKGVVGNTLVVSNQAFAKGVTDFDKLKGASVAITQVGSSFHYQLGQIAAAKGFPLSTISMKPLQSIPNMVAAVKTGQVDATILPPHIAGPMGERGEVKVIGPLSAIGDYQYGALFAAPKIVSDNRALAERFTRAYVKGLADYNAALMRVDSSGKRILDAASAKAAEQIAKYVYPSDPAAQAAKNVIASAVFCDAAGHIDVADIERQIAWYKSEKLVDASVEAKNFVDTSFTK